VIKTEIKGITFFKFRLLKGEKGLFHAISTRTGGVSSPPFFSLNLGFNIGDRKGNVIENHKRIASLLGFNISCLVSPSQVHKDKIRYIGKQYIGRYGFLPEYSPRDCDALITNVAGVVLMIRVADCVPVFLYDKKKRCIGVVHAGKEGTRRNITAKTVRALCKRFSCHPKDLLACIGPSIGPCCYEINLWDENLNQLLKEGVPLNNIELSSLCTSCHTELFFSFRKEKAKTGRFGAFLGLL